MEHLIVDSTPKGSAILAYGTSGGSQRRFLIFAVIIALILCSVTVIAWFWVNGLTITLPKDRLALAVVRPSAICSKLDATLLQSLPPAWRSALETRSVFPAVLGVALDGQRQMRAFALIVRSSSIAIGPELREHNEGALRLLTDTQTDAFEDIPFQTVTSLYRRLRNNDVAWSVNGRALVQLADSIGSTDLAETSEDVRGTWNGSQGTIDLPVTDTNTEDGLDTPVFAVLGGSIDESAPAIASLMSFGLDIRTIAASPHIIAADPNAGAPLIIRWRQPLLAGDTRTLKNAVGENALRDYALPDETVLRELVPGSTTSTVPFTVIRGESSSTWILTDAELRLAGNSPSTLPQNPSCPGSVLFRISDQSLQQLLTLWNMPAVWRERLHSFQLSQTEHGVIFCAD